MDEFDFSGRRVLVVGAGGLGAAIAAGFAAHGATVAAADVDGDRAAGLARELSAAHGVTATGIPVDVTDETSVRAMVVAAVRELGGLDVLVNAAGVTVRTRAEDLAPDDWRRILDINATGTFLCCQAAGAHMARAGGGAIVNLSSVRGRYGATFGQAEYSASKGAVDALTRVARRPVGGARHPRQRRGADLRRDRPHALRPRRRAVRRRAARQHPDGSLGRDRGRRGAGAVLRLTGGAVRDRPDPVRGRRSHGARLVFPHSGTLVSARGRAASAVAFAHARSRCLTCPDPCTSVRIMD